MIYVGCDVGQSGGIIGISGESRILFKYAVHKKTEDKLDFYRELASVFGELKKLDEDIIFCIEDVHSLYGMSAKSNFNFGGIKHAKMMASIIMGFETHLVTPKNWQRAVWLPKDVVLKENKRSKDTKATSLNAAKRLWPHFDWRRTERSKIPHDGIIDAALIAEYCRIVNN